TGSLAFSPDGRTLAWAVADDISLWDPAAGQELRRFTWQEVKETPWIGMHPFLAFSPDGRRLATERGEGSLTLLDVASARKQRLMRGGQMAPLPFAFSPDGKTLVAAADGEGCMRFWEVATGRERRRLRVPGDWVRWLRFFPDGKTVASAHDDGLVRLWEAATGKEFRQLRGHDGPAWSLDVSADGQTLVSGGRDGTIRLWNAATGKELRRRGGGGEKGVACVAFSPDGRTVASWDQPLLLKHFQSFGDPRWNQLHSVRLWD